MDKLKNFIYINKNITVFLVVLMLTGIFFGSLLPIFLSVDDKKLVADYLLNFIGQVKSGCDSLFLLSNGLLSNCLFLILIWLLGISVIGVPIVLFFFFYKCFILGFSISSIIFNYGFKGILFSFAYIFPHHVFNIFIYSILTSFSLIFSIRLLLLFFKKNDFNIRGSFNKYLKILLFCLITLLISVLYEAFINPYILSFVFNLLGL